MWSAYLYGLNNRPFNSGANFTLKGRLLDLFKLRVTIESPVFVKHMCRIAKAWDLPCETAEERQVILDRVCSMRSFTTKRGQPKVSNWFAWNKCAHEQMDEFHATKMVFEDHLPEQPDPDACGSFETGSRNPRKQLQQMLKQQGGLPLAYKLMREELHDHVVIMWVAEKASWDWYTKEVTDCKTPRDAFRYSLRLSEGEWRREEHLWGTVYNTLQHPNFLREMAVPPGESKKATRALMLQWYIVAQRAWTLTKHDCPPESYAPLLSSEAPRAQATARQLEREHAHILALELRRFAVPDARRLWIDISFLHTRTLRLLFEFYARDQYRVDSAAGRSLLLGLLWTMPDNKCVENIHNPLRLDSRANSNRRLSSNHVQDVIVNSDVLETRGIRHTPRPNKATFTADFRSTPPRSSLAAKHKSSKHKLPKEWSQVLHPRKTWPTLSEATNQRMAAAWSWLDKFLLGRGVSLPNDTRIGFALFSKLVLPGTIVRKGGVCFASLGNALWGALGWPLDAFDVAGGRVFEFRRAPVEWIHVIDPREWEVVPFAAVRHMDRGKILMEQRGEETPLMQHCLLQKGNNLHCDDLARCAALLGAAAPPGDAEALLGALAHALAPEDTALKEVFLNNYLRSDDPDLGLLKECGAGWGVRRGLRKDGRGGGARGRRRREEEGGEQRGGRGRGTRRRRMRGTAEEEEEQDEGGGRRRREEQGGGTRRAGGGTRRRRSTRYEEEDEGEGGGRGGAGSGRDALGACVRCAR